MRLSPIAAFVLVFHVVVSAFPFVVGRAMEYSVIRGNGAEKSRVILTPLSVRQDSGKHFWTIQVRDTLVAGYRYPEVVSTQLELRVDDSALAETTSPCQVPWDFEGRDNPTPFNVWQGVKRSSVCGRSTSAARSAAVSLSGDRQTVDSSTCSSSSLTTCTYYKDVSTFSGPQGIWNDDSGWISYQDGSTGASWLLTRIGSGARLPDIRLRASSVNPAKSGIHDVRAKDVWTYSRVVDWRQVNWAQSGYDSLSGSDTTKVVWTAVRRLGDTGLVGTWLFARKRTTGSMSSVDSLAIDLDSPLPLAEVRNPSDLDLAIFRRYFMPPLDGPLAASSFGWTKNSTGTAWYENVSLRRDYSFTAEGDFEKMLQTYQKRGQGYLMNPEADTATTIVLLEFARSLSSGVAGPGASFRTPSTRSLSDLDLLVSRGGQILSIRDARGVRRDVRVGKPSESLRGVHGVVFLEATTPEGHPFQARLALP